MSTIQHFFGIANMLRQGKKISVRIRKNKVIIIVAFIFVCPTLICFMGKQPTPVSTMRFTGPGSQSKLEESQNGRALVTVITTEVGRGSKPDQLSSPPGFFLVLNPYSPALQSQKKITCQAAENLIPLHEEENTFTPGKSEVKHR